MGERKKVICWLHVFIAINEGKMWPLVCRKSCPGKQRPDSALDGG